MNLSKSLRDILDFHPKILAVMQLAPHVNEIFDASPLT